MIGAVTMPLYHTVPSMVRSAWWSPSVTLDLNSKRRLLHKSCIVECALEAHSSSAKWDAKQANTEGGSMKFDLETRATQSVVGGVVALGKFDALHVGHRALAERAAELGAPFLVSFSGMAEVLGWEARLPVVAKCDRTRVMGLWARHCGNVVPQEYVLDFVKVRSLSPEQFVEKLALELKVKGVVAVCLCIYKDFEEAEQVDHVIAGANYRFGYRAAGDASDLVRLCQQYGLQSAIVDPVMDALKLSSPVLVDDNSREKGQVSTTRVRKALAKGDMRRVVELLGRTHRIIIKPDNLVRTGNLIKAPIASLLNVPPQIGSYDCTLVLDDSHDYPVSNSIVGKLTIGETELTLVLEDASLVDMVPQLNYIALEFLP